MVDVIYMGSDRISMAEELENLKGPGGWGTEYMEDEDKEPEDYDICIESYNLPTRIATEYISDLEMREGWHFKIFERPNLICGDVKEFMKLSHSFTEDIIENMVTDYDLLKEEFFDGDEDKVIEHLYKFNYFEDVDDFLNALDVISDEMKDQLFKRDIYE